MDFTVSILDYQLNRLYRTEHRGSWNHRMILKQILLWDNTGGRENALYLFPQFLQNVMRRPSAHDLAVGAPGAVHLQPQSPEASGLQQRLSGHQPDHRGL